MIAMTTNNSIRVKPNLERERGMTRLPASTGQRTPATSAVRGASVFDGRSGGMKGLRSVPFGGGAVGRGEARFPQKIEEHQRGSLQNESSPRGPWIEADLTKRQQKRATWPRT